MPQAFDQRSIFTHDGARIAYQIRGNGPAVVLANGLGGDIAAWRFVDEALGSERRVVCWDYRGLYRSGPPPSPNTLGPVEQARDLVGILEKEGIEKFVLCGWSMGVQVSFEVIRLLGERVVALAAINGVPGRPFDTALAWRLSRHVIPLLIQQMRRRASTMGMLTRWSVGWRGLLPTMQRLGLASATLDSDVFDQVALGFANVDFDVYGATLEALGRHDAWDMLRSLRIPTTIITGDRDLMTPVSTARRMAAQIADSKLVVLEGATHYSPVEFPARVSEEIVALLSRVGF